uniref:Uncharacterized protein n=1 Tax=Pan troglodytes TaxID=9598 RepID=A0A2I3T3C1_PANTR
MGLKAKKGVSPPTVAQILEDVRGGRGRVILVFTILAPRKVGRSGDRGDLISPDPCGTWSLRPWETTLPRGRPEPRGP